MLIIYFKFDFIVFQKKKSVHDSLTSTCTSTASEACARSSSSSSGNSNNNYYPTTSIKPCTNHLQRPSHHRLKHCRFCERIHSMHTTYKDSSPNDKRCRPCSKFSKMYSRNLINLCFPYISFSIFFSLIFSARSPFLSETQT